MDRLDRMYRHLVRTIRSRFPDYLTQPFSVGELQSTILPYRLHRRELGLETNDEYEITLSELLSGARDYLVVDGQMRDALRGELGSVNPDPSTYKRFANANVTLSATALRGLEVGPEDDSAPLRTPVPSQEAMPASQGASAPQRAPEPQPPMPAADTPIQESRPAVSAGRESRPAAAPAATRESARTPMTTTSAGIRSVVPQPGERCRSCNEALPPGRAIIFCPHCGQNLTTMNCPACGAELELGWKFCPSCGRPARNM